jgi:hypothetical protein
MKRGVKHLGGRDELHKVIINVELRENAGSLESFP